MPHERAWLDRIYDELGWVDIFQITEERTLTRGGQTGAGLGH